MANPIRQLITATGAAAPQVLDFFQTPFNVTVGVDISNAVGAVYGVQYTLSDPTNMLYQTGGVLQNPTVAPLWRNDPTLGPGQNANGQTSYSNPVVAVRLNVTALTSGTIVLEIVQGLSAQR